MYTDLEEITLLSRPSQLIYTAIFSPPFLVCKRGSIQHLKNTLAHISGRLQSIPDGPVILAGHSMGGLLVAEAATDSRPVARRIIGLLAFDTPYLGMHPHVVISGIASLFQKKEDEEKKEMQQKGQTDAPGTHRPPAPSAQGLAAEQDINDNDAVNFVKPQDAFASGTTSPNPTSATSDISHEQQISALLPPSRPNSPPQSPSHSALLSPSDAASSSHSKTSATSWLTSATSFFKKHADDPFVRFLTKHSDAPVSAVSRWVVEHFEFGFAMFDYAELIDRYHRLEKWDGDWVNYWSVTPGEDAAKMKRETNPSTVFENEFQMAMRKASQKEAKRKEKETAKAAEQEQKQRIKKEQEDEKRRRKEEEAQEKERKKAAEAIEKEKRKKEEVERKEKAAAEKEKSKLKKQKKEEDGEQAETSQAKEPNAPSEYLAPPQVVIEESDDEDDARSMNSYRTAQETVLVADSRTEDGSKSSPHSPMHSAPASPPLSKASSHSLVASPALSKSSSQLALASPALSKTSSRPPTPPNPNAAYHFITLPGKYHGGNRRRWLKVRIEGVEDEVAAHCGLFIRNQNLQYDAFVARVGELVKSWVL
ncbi:6804_t:CDS:2 [Acaulospora colombiana]|uniref:6804_t:CDS:1 n=1 Tax=Acaulospora colombiana TaxID=27376 RepID=A0ACA9M1W9_9GLOM|nr:6804_t:CDS:2 [Acaulospora colombiana]